MFGMFTTRDWRMIDTAQRKGDASNKQSDAIILADPRAIMIQIDDQKAF